MSLPIVIAIVGPTASGKTKLAQALTKAIWSQAPNQFSGVDFLSADSRQVYQGLEITTGADIPADSTRQTNNRYPYPFYVQQLTNNLFIHWHGTSILPPTQSWSVAELRQLAHTVIAKAGTQNRLVFIIGGTGLYHQAITDASMADLIIKPDLRVRAKAEEMDIAELQTWLAQIDPPTLNELNESDRQNPRRLIRHIERAIHKQNHPNLNSTHTAPVFQQLTVGTQHASIDTLAAAINQRVKQRIEQGALQEVGVIDLTTLDSQANTTLGLREIRGFLNSEYDLAALEEMWTLHEKQYAKRQLTWWKKRPNITWLNPDTSGQIDGLVQQILEMTASA